MRLLGTLYNKKNTLETLTELVFEQSYLHLEFYVLLKQLIPALLQLEDALEHTTFPMILVERLQYFLFAKFTDN
jgi:hypothetical protein